MLCAGQMEIPAMQATIAATRAILFIGSSHRKLDVWAVGTLDDVGWLAVKQRPVTRLLVCRHDEIDLLHADLSWRQPLKRDLDWGGWAKDGLARIVFEVQASGRLGGKEQRLRRGCKGD